VPLFELERVREAGRLGKVGLQRTAQRDIQELGYSLDDVHHCIATLRAEDFHKTEAYGDHLECDVYLRGFPGTSGAFDDLYIKLRIPPTSIPQVLVVSFHLQR
jgi:hypothetical protein